MDNIEQLIKQCIEGKKSAQEQLFKLYYPYVFKISFSWLQNKENAEDASLIAIHAIFNALATYKSAINEFKPWVRRIAINTSITWMRKHNRHQYHEVFDNQENLAVSERDAGVEYDAKIIIQWVENLRWPHREILKLHALEGFSHAEIAEILQISVPYSRVCLHEARKKLENYLYPNPLTNPLKP